MADNATNGPDDPVLWGADGKPRSLEGALFAPNALNVASVIQNVGKVYSYRWDEAMRDAPANALAMRRDTFYLALIQERTAPTINLEWQVEVDDEDDPRQQRQCEAMNRAWRELPDKPGLISWLTNGAVWFGRSASQAVWGKSESGLANWVFHEPVHGDSIQFQWDNTPVVLVSAFTADRVRATDPAAVVRSTDRGAYGLRLYKPEYRRRFVIHKHVREAADYYEGEMSGGVHGVGLRSWLYWGDYIRRDTLAAMLGFLNSTGMMDLLVFNFPDGNKEAESRAIENAKMVSGKIALVCPRDPAKDWPAVEQLSMNTAGVEVLQSLIANYFDRHAERLVVGQSMSAGADAESGLGGTGRAEFAADTKFQIVKTDALRLGESLTRDWLLPCRDYNFPGSTVPMRMVPVLEDPRADRKVQNAATLIQAGIEIEAAELRKAAGFRDPRPGKPTVGGRGG